MMGYSPTLVSPESMTASAPSSTALATSLASARVGRGRGDHRLEHLGGDDDGLGVAAGLVDDQLLEDRDVLERALDAQVAARDHDRRRRRRTISSMFVDRLRLLDLGDDRDDDVLLVHDRAHVVGVGRAADEAEGDEVDAEVAAPSAGPRCPSRTAPGTETATPGRLMPLWLETLPPTIDLGDARRCRRPTVTRSRTLPSSMRIGSPASRRPAARRTSCRTRRRRPRTSRVVIVNVAPFLSLTGPSANGPSRILGPWRSAKMPTPWPDSSLAWRTRR